MRELAKKDLFVYKFLERLRKDGADTWFILWSRALIQIRKTVQLT